MKLPIAIVIPAYNEELNIQAVVAGVLPVCTEVIVVDDCSRDQTYQFAVKAGATVLRGLVNRGQGAALRIGTAKAIANGDKVIVHFDADGQFLVKDIEKIVEPILAGEAEIVFGSRFLDDTTKMPYFKKAVIMPLARFINYLFFGIRLTDPQSGFRAFSASAYPQIFWQQDGMAHCSEILYLAHKHNLKIKEVPITVIYTEFGQRLSGGFKIIKELIISRLLS